MIGNRVLGVLVLIGGGAALGLAYLTVAPNRLVLGAGIPLADLMHGWRPLMLLPALFLCIAVFLTPARRTHVTIALAAYVLLFAFVWLAGLEAARVASTAPSASRVSVGGGFWALLAVTWLIAADALQRLGMGAAWRTAAGACALLPVIGLLVIGELNQLSLVKEYANRQEVFDAALRRHVEIVAVTLIPTLAIGIPLGLALFRKERLAPQSLRC